MAVTKIKQLSELGQSAWLDYISRSIIRSGELRKLINEGLKGMTSNPTIFEKAVSTGPDYDNQIIELARNNMSSFEIYDEITIKDIQDAADMFGAVYYQTDKLDGYVSLEINPKYAHDTQRTIEEGKRLYEKVGRPNVMFKVPATEEGYPAISSLLGEGINVNVTLIFSPEQYEKTAKAYIDGISKLTKNGKDIRRVYSVASVFVSRLDSSVDKLIDQSSIAELAALRGKAAVANAQFIYQKFMNVFSSEDFRRLKAQGVNIQRVLWGSTGTKDPKYSEIKYVQELIGKDTVNTMPEKTFKSFLYHGVAEETIFNNIDLASEIFESLKKHGIIIEEIYDKLLADGLAAFESSFDSLLKCIEEKVERLTGITVA